MKIPVRWRIAYRLGSVWKSEFFPTRAKATQAAETIAPMAEKRRVYVQSWGDRGMHLVDTIKARKVKA